MTKHRMNHLANQSMRWMRRHRVLTLMTLMALALLVLCSWLGYNDPETTLAVGMLVAGVEGDTRHVVDGPLTTELTNEGSPELLLNEIDQQIVKIRPMSTPIDQISRYASSKHAGSMVVDYYSVDTKPTSAQLVSYTTDSATSSNATPTLKLTTSNNDIFDATDTILCQGVPGYDEDGNVDNSNLMLYVMSRDSSNGLVVAPVNGPKSDDGQLGSIDDLAVGTSLVRMGRAASELDVQSPQFEALPHKSRNYCQIFKMQVEQSLLQRLSNKEVGWTLSDQQEAAIYDMRLGMEKSFLFGTRRQLWDSEKKETIMFTGGIWYQCGKDFNIESSNGVGVDQVVDLMRTTFTGNLGSKRKILIGGSELISVLSKLDYTRVVTAGQYLSKWGIDFTELRSKFGCLYLLLSEVFDEAGMANSGIVIDPEYLQKYVHIPFSTEQLSLKKSGVRNVDALVLTEASCLVLRYPKSHVRINMR